MIARGLVALVFSCSLFALVSTGASAQAGATRTFAAPEEAVKALLDIVKKGDLNALLALFGTDGKELIAASDPVAARQNLQVFAVAAREQWRLDDAAPDRKTLVVGYEEWPFPVPLVKSAQGWQFDTAAGREEVLARRIGRNELSAIATTRAYVGAQQRYAAQAHDGKQAGVYAGKFRSDPGEENGLYWPTGRGQKRSPLGDLVAEAAAEGRPAGASNSQRSAFHGYHFKILTAQGKAASGGARNYVVKGDMTGGFALVAWPAQYDVTGVMTFVVNQDGSVRQKDLGPDTDAAARKMTAYNPDASWQEVK